MTREVSSGLSPDLVHIQNEQELALQIAQAVQQAGGRALLVGGYPRDQLMNQLLGTSYKSKDLDLEIYGLTLDKLVKLVEPIHHINEVGKSFGVLKVGPLDIALPRKDSKRGAGHRGFDVEVDPSLSHKEAARRRDLTINSMVIDPLTSELIDEWGGADDIRKKLLKMVDPQLFGDDPLRALRVMQFAGRFGFGIDPDTAKACQSFDLKELSSERIGEEWRKLLRLSEKPSLGLQAARELGIIQQLHPELAATIGCQQEHDWHPEGDVWNHSLLAVDIAAQIVRREQLGHDEALTILLGALCHDFGKPATTIVKDGRIRSPEHAKAGVELAKSFMKQLHMPEAINHKVQRLVFDHMFLPEVARAKDAAIRRLAVRLEPASVQELIWVTEADFCGRTIPELDTSLITLFQKRADELAVADSAEAPLVQGRDLIALGITPGKAMGDILHKLLEEQLEGQFGTKEGGIAYYQEHLTS